MSEREQKLSPLQKKGLLLVGGIAAPFLLYIGMSLKLDWLSGISAILIAGIMLAVILVK